MRNVKNWILNPYTIILFLYFIIGIISCVSCYGQGREIKTFPTSSTVDNNTYFLGMQLSGGVFGNGLKVPATQIASYISAVSGVSSFNLRTGAVTLMSSDVITALGFTPEQQLTFFAPLARTTTTHIGFDYSYAGTFISTQTFLQGVKVSSVSASPSTPSTGVNIHSLGNNTLSIIGTNGFSWNVLSSSLSASRVYTACNHNFTFDNININTTTNLSGILIGNGSTIAAILQPSGTVVGTTDVQTLTNKRITPRDGSISSSATPTINTDNLDQYRITALAANITSFTTNLSGTPTKGEVFVIEITDNGAAYTIAWGSSFEDGYINALPLTTDGASSLIGVVLKWNSATSKWRCAGLY